MSSERIDATRDIIANYEVLTSLNRANSLFLSILTDLLQVNSKTNKTGNEKFLRTGKWTYEESKYAEALIAHFEVGMLLDCDNGDTLRGYLSEKLSRNPMSVSKKFAGRYCLRIILIFF